VILNLLKALHPYLKVLAVRPENHWNHYPGFSPTRILVMALYTLNSLILAYLYASPIAPRSPLKHHKNNLVGCRKAMLDAARKCNRKPSVTAEGRAMVIWQVPVCPGALASAIEKKIPCSRILVYLYLTRDTLRKCMKWSFNLRS
jgi:hypothetical protein